MGDRKRTPATSDVEMIDGKPARTARVDAAKLKVDADTFQFKSGGDHTGVTDRLRGVQQWNPLAAGKVMVWENKAGEQFIGDGHQRTGLAKRLMSEGHAPIKMDAIVLKEADGWTPKDVRAYAAVKNMHESSGQSLDMAKVMRERPDLVKGSLPISDAKIKEAKALSKLSDPAFKSVTGGMIKPEVAAAVGELVGDATRHADLLAEMKKANVASGQHARVYTQQALAAKTLTETTSSLFGEETTTRTLLKERAAALDKALTQLKSDKRIFGLLEREAANIEGAGNKLAHETNQARATDAGKLAEMVEKLSQTRGPVSSMLDKAAEAIAKGESPAKAARQFVREVGDTMKGGGMKALMGDAPSAPAPAPAPATAPQAAPAQAERTAAMAKAPGQTSMLPEATTREQIAAAMKNSGKPAAPQAEVGGLFGDSHKQTDLVDMSRQMKAAEAPKGESWLDAAAKRGEGYSRALDELGSRQAKAAESSGKPAGWSDAARDASAEARGVAKPGEAKPDAATRAAVSIEDAKAKGGRPVKVNVAALANDIADAKGPQGNGSGAGYARDLDNLKASAGPNKTAHLIEETGGRRYLQFDDGTTFENPRAGTYRDESVKAPAVEKPAAKPAKNRNVGERKQLVENQRAELAAKKQAEWQARKDRKAEAAKAATAEAPAHKGPPKLVGIPADGAKPFTMAILDSPGDPHTAAERIFKDTAHQYTQKLSGYRVEGAPEPKPGTTPAKAPMTDGEFANNLREIRQQNAGGPATPSAAVEAAKRGDLKAFAKAMNSNTTNASALLKNFKAGKVTEARIAELESKVTGKSVAAPAAPAAGGAEPPKAPPASGNSGNPGPSRAEQLKTQIAALERESAMRAMSDDFHHTNRGPSGAAAFDKQIQPLKAELAKLEPPKAPAPVSFTAEELAEKGRPYKLETIDEAAKRVGVNPKRATKETWDRLNSTPQARAMDEAMRQAVRDMNPPKAAPAAEAPAPAANPAADAPVKVREATPHKGTPIPPAPGDSAPKAAPAAEAPAKGPAGPSQAVEKFPKLFTSASVAESKPVREAPVVDMAKLIDKRNETALSHIEVAKATGNTSRLAIADDLVSRNERALAAAEPAKGTGPAGWSDEAREASAKARGVAAPGEAKAPEAPAKASASTPDLAERIKGLKKAQLMEVAKEVNAQVSGVKTAKGLREAILKRQHEAYRDGAKAASTGELYGPVDRGGVMKAAEEAKARTTTAIEQAVGKAEKSAGKAPKAPRAAKAKAAPAPAAQAPAPAAPAAAPAAKAPAQIAAPPKFPALAPPADPMAAAAGRTAKSTPPPLPPAAQPVVDARPASVPATLDKTAGTGLGKAPGVASKAAENTLKLLGPTSVIGAAAVAFDQSRTEALAKGESQGSANVKGTLAGVGAGGMVAGIGYGITKGIGLLSKVAPVAGAVASRAVPVVAAGMAAYDMAKGYQKDGLKGAAMGLADFATMGAASHFAGKSSQANSPEAGPRSATDAVPGAKQAEAYAKMDAIFSARMTENAAAQPASGEGGPKGWANPAVQMAAQQARGVENVTDWAASGAKAAAAEPDSGNGKKKAPKVY